MAKVVDPLAPFWRAIQDTPLAKIDYSHLCAELERIKRRDITPFLDAEAQHRKRMAVANMVLIELPEERADKLTELLTAWRDDEREQAERCRVAIEERSSRFFWQCEILRLIQWSGSTELRTNPIFRAAYDFVFESPHPITKDYARKLIGKYRTKHFKKEKGPILLIPAYRVATSDV
jgi:hypothetical protein